MRYEVTRQGADEGARDAERDGGQQLSPLREAELSLRGRGGATSTDGPQLFEGEPNQVLDPSTGDGGTGSPSDAALSRGTRPPNTFNLRLQRSNSRVRWIHGASRTTGSTNRRQAPR